jgi:hypothetical protein
LILGRGPLQLVEAGLEGSLKSAISLSTFDETLRVMREKSTFAEKVDQRQAKFLISCAAGRGLPKVAPRELIC